MGVVDLRSLSLVLVASGCGRIGFDPPTATLTGDAVADGISFDCVAGTGVVATSCQAPLACGPTGTTSCCDSPPVCGGSFYRGYDASSDAAFKDTAHPATITTLRLDRYEVTVGRFRRFVDAGMGTQASPPPIGAGARTLNGVPDQAGWDSAWNANLVADQAALLTALDPGTCGGSLETWTNSPAGNENRPIECLTWYEAMAFCVWDGGFLPTEAESMYAASGGTLQRAFAWSNPAASTTIDCSLANISVGSYGCTGSGANDVGSMSPTGNGAWGHADLGGNEWEWVLDWWATSLQMPCTDCANLVPATMRVFRGGGYNVDGSLSRAASRYDDMTDTVATFRHPALGVRCARAP